MNQSYRQRAKFLICCLLLESGLDLCYLPVLSAPSMAELNEISRVQSHC